MGRGSQEILFHAKSTRQVVLEPMNLPRPLIVDFLKILAGYLMKKRRIK
jgi:hypothetical protein